MATHAFIYVRQSINHPDGIDRGLNRARTLVKQRGWTLAHEYVDNDVSASKVRRADTDWARMLEAIKRGEAEFIVGVDLDRLVRGLRDLLTLIDLGVKVITVDGELDLTTAEGEMRATILTGMARFEVRRKAERQIRANEHLVQQGRPVPGRRRFGFENDGITLREVEAAQVRSLFARFADGASIRSLAKEMGWRNVRMRDTLANAAYVGRLKHHGVEYEAPGVVRTVDVDLFRRVQDMLSDPSRRTSPGSTYRHLMSGIARCGVCGRTLVRMADYRCPESATHVSIMQPTLDRAVLRQVVAALTMAPRSAFDAAPDVQPLLDALADVVRRREALRELVEAGYPAADAVPQMRRLSNDAHRIEGQLAEARARTSTARMLADLSGSLWTEHTVDLEQVSDARQRVLERFEALPLEERRELVRGLLDVVVQKGRTPDRIQIRHRIATTLDAA